MQDTIRPFRLTLCSASLLGLLTFVGPMVGTSSQSGSERGVAGQVQSTWDRVSTTQQQISVGGTTLKYTVRAGFMPIRATIADEPRGHMFYTAYTLEGAGLRTARPITFLWNGGPGSNSALLNLLAVGPKRMKLKEDGDTSAALLDNESTWLPESDLVFVDPIGTGYSRPTKEEYARLFWNIQGDVDSVAEFIRGYLARYKVASAPLFIAGESYGTVRAAGLAEALPNLGIPLKGIILISGALGSQSGSDLRYPLILPSYTAAAFVHKKLPADLLKDLSSTLREVESWAETHYMPALMKGDRLEGAERDRVLDQLARYTGLDKAVLDRMNLRPEMVPFARQLLRDQQRVLSHYDVRVTARRVVSDAEQYDPRDDPSLDVMDGVSKLMANHLASDLGFQSDSLYAGPFGGWWPTPANPRGDWMSQQWDWGPSGPSTDRSAPLRRALLRNRTLKVLVASGLYDLATPYFATDYVLSHMGLSPEVRRNITVVHYLGGHSMYTSKAERADFTRDVRTFMQACLAPAASPSMGQ